MRYSQDTLRMALVGFQAKLEEINGRISEIQQELRGAPRRKGPGTERRSMSAAGRKRIAAAQRARWAAYRKRHQAAA